MRGGDTCKDSINLYVYNCEKNIPKDKKYHFYFVK